jgi:AbrB family looped-hinge helix DNA binding protein
MTVTVKSKTPLVVPTSIRRRAGIRPGDKIEFTASGGVITIVAKPECATNEYTAAQRRAILGDVRKGVAEIEAGDFFGPFESVEELKACVEDRARNLTRAKIAGTGRVARQRKTPK